MYYDDNIDDLDVSLSEAFQFDSLLDKAASARKVDRETVAINEHFAIYKGSKFAVMKRCENRWCYIIYTTSFFDDYTGKTFDTDKYAEFDTREEALGFINGFTAFLQWFGEIVATSQKAEETKEMTKTQQIAQSLHIPVSEVESIASIAFEMKQQKHREQRSRYIDDLADAYERQFEFDKLARLKALTIEQGLDVKGRSKKMYINALVAKYRLNLMNEVYQ